MDEWLWRKIDLLKFQINFNTRLIGYICGVWGAWVVVMKCLLRRVVHLRFHYYFIENYATTQHRLLKTLAFFNAKKKTKRMKKSQREKSGNCIDMDVCKKKSLSFSQIPSIVFFSYSYNVPWIETGSTFNFAVNTILTTSSTSINRINIEIETERANKRESEQGRERER